MSFIGKKDKLLLGDHVTVKIVYDDTPLPDAITAQPEETLSYAEGIFYDVKQGLFVQESNQNTVYVCQKTLKPIINRYSQSSQESPAKK